MVGKTIGHYDIVAPLGAGGMGEVYQARDTTLKRDVAVKVLSAEFVDDPNRLARLEREAHLLASLNHPNIATIHSLEHEGDTRFLVLELVQGQSLERHLTRGPLTVEKAVSLAKQIAEALEAAHGEGIIHRDLKPANVVITPDGRVKVLDFGIAKTVDTGATNVGTEATNLTVAGTLVGTVPYMSPEQIRGETVDKRVDVWAFGCVLFEMLTGGSPFGRETVADTLAAIIEQEPDWGRLPAPTPDSVRSLLHRCLQKDMKLRLRDLGDAWVEMNALTTDAAGVLTGSISIPGTVAAGATVPEKRSATPWIAAALIGGMAAGALSMWFSTGSTGETGPPPVRHVEISLEVDQRVFGVVALSPDGRDLVYVAAVPGGARLLHHRPWSEPAARVLEGSEGALAPFFSPDGESVGFFAPPDIKKVALSGGPVQTVCGGCVTGSSDGATWLPDQTIVFATSGDLFVVSADRGTPVLFGPGGPDRTAGYSRPSALPGGEGILVQLDASDGSSDGMVVAIVGPDGGEPRILAESGANPTYSRTGHVLFSRDGSLFAAPFDLQLRQATGQPELLLEGVEPNFSLSGDGTLVYPQGSSSGRDQVNEVMLIDLEGNATSLIDEPYRYWGVRRSPDGRRLALTVQAPGRRRQIWLYDVDGAAMVGPITFEGDNQFPLWFPDGEGVAFSSDGSLVWKRADDLSREPERLTSAAGRRQRPGSFSPDGKTLAFSERYTDGNDDIMLVSMGGDGIPEPFIATPEREHTPRFSPDGHWMTYTSNLTGVWQVFVTPFPEHRPYRVSQAGAHAISAEWAPDGRTIYYRTQVAMMATPFEPRPEGAPVIGEPTILFEDDDVHDRYVDRPQYDIAPGGEEFAMLTWPKPIPEGPLAKINVVFNWAERLKELAPPGR